MLRYFASFRMVKEVGEDLYTSSNFSNAMDSDGLKAGISYL